MLGRKQEFHVQLQKLLDALLIAMAFLLCHSLRYYKIVSLGRLDTYRIPPLADFLWLFVIIVFLTPFFLEKQGFYRYPLQKTVWKSLQQMFQALVWVGLVIGACVVFFKWGANSRSVLLLLAVVSAALLLFKEWLLKRFLLKRVKSGHVLERVVLIGVDADLARLEKKLSPELNTEMKVVGRISIDRASYLDELIEALHKDNVERVIVGAGRAKFYAVEEIITVCEVEGVEAWLMADFIQTVMTQPKFDALSGQPMLVFRNTPDTSWSLFFKEALDRFGALLLILITSPLWLVAYIGVRLSSPGPVIFRQLRGGHYGKPFLMFKFRTMREGAEKQREDLLEENEMSGPVFKVENDPRIFSFGRWLRKYSIDELPQLINVLLGQMSLVGPRPLPVYEVEKIEHSAHRRRLSVRPGLTCLWQIGGRNKIQSFEEWVKLDLKYIDNWSLWLDLKILLYTLPAVLRGAGAK